MHMFDMNRQYSRPIVAPIVALIVSRSNMYITVYHTNKRSIKDTIGVVVNRLVGIGLKPLGHRD